MRFDHSVPRAAAALLTLTLLVACARQSAPPGGSDRAGASSESPPAFSVSTISGEPESGFNATAVSGIDYGRGLVLKDANGRPRRLEDWKGKVLLVFFGFASCPDVCPTTLMRLAEARKQLGADAAQVQVVFVTLDPERDTPERVKAYTKQFDPSFIALRPEPGQMDELQRSFRIVAVKVPVPDTDTYMIDHSSPVYVYDRTNALRLVATAGFEVPALAADLAKLVAGKG